MNKKIIGFLCFCAFDATSGPSFGSKAAGIQKIEKASEQVKEALEKNDISGVNARLRVEGAEFRLFNLFFPQAQTSVLLSSLERQYCADIRAIIERDLAITGGFKLMSDAGVSQKINSEELLKQKGAEGASYLSLSFRGPLIKVALEHKNFLNGQASKKNFEGSVTNIRYLAHQLSQSIYESYVGPEDIFLRQIAAIRKQNGVNQVVLLDFDGHGEQLVSSGSSMKSGPFFAPNGKTILYTIISDQGQRIVEQEIGSKNIQERTKKTGLNLDPRVLPDNSGLLATLSLGKSANIYKTSRTGAELLGKITNSIGLNLSPSVSADGTLVVFVSDRAGSPQIYEQLLKTENSPAKRLTFQGRYNQTPHYSPDASLVAFTGRDEQKVFDIFLLERSSNRVSRVTQKQGRNQEPFFTPSGRFVIFSSERDDHSAPELYIASLNGAHQVRLTKNGGYLSPVVRPGTPALRAGSLLSPL